MAQVKKFRSLPLVTLSLLIGLISHTPSHAEVGQCVELNLINVDEFSEPTAFYWNPTDSNWLVTEKTGQLYSLSPRTGLRSLITTFDTQLDLRATGGLVGVALHPQYPEQPHLFISRTVNREYDRLLVLERYDMLRQNVDLESKKEFLKVVLPGISNVGGFLTFDEMGNLLMTIGDGSDDRDSSKHAISMHSLPGTLTRLNVDSNSNNYIAPNNPFLDYRDGASEVYAYGFRNPTSVHVDKPTGNIWLLDSGNQATGEINLIQGKYFYGWSCIDGNRLIDNSEACKDSEKLSLIAQPKYIYDSSEGNQIVGGVIYRGRQNPNWVGRYFFADLIRGKIWHTSLRGDTEIDKNAIQLAYTGSILPISMALDSSQEIYLLDLKGRVFSMLGRSCTSPQKIIRPKKFVSN